MKYSSHSKIVAISTDDHKQAALMFDKILPVYSYDAVPNDIRFDYRHLKDTLKVATLGYTTCRSDGQYPQMGGEEEFEFYSFEVRQPGPRLIIDHDPSWRRADGTTGYAPGNHGEYYDDDDVFWLNERALDSHLAMRRLGIQSVPLFRPNEVGNEEFFSGAGEATLEPSPSAQAPSGPIADG